MDRKSLLAATLCIILYVAWTQYLQMKYPDYGKIPEQTSQPTEQSADQDISTDNQETSQSSATIAQNSDEPPQPIIETPRLSRDELTIENDVIAYQFDQDRAGLVSVVLKDYKATPDKDDHTNVDLISSLITIQAFADDERHPVVSDYQTSREGKTMTFIRQQGPWRITQNIDLSQPNYGGLLKITYENTSDKLQDLTAAVIMRERVTLPKDSSSWLPIAMQQHSFIVGSGGSREEENMRSYCEEDGNEPALVGTNEPLDFIGFDRHYFVKALVADGKRFNYRVSKEKPTTGAEPCSMIMALNQPYGMIEAGKSVELTFATYFGPKDPDLLAATSASLRETLYLGWFSIIARPLMWVVKSINGVTGNYGIAIILLTICLKLLFYPLTRAAAVSMKRMQQFTPELNRIKEKYKEDKQAQNREVMAFMTKHKINPAKGCLPILPQIPVFIAFYNVLSHSIELRHAPFFGWIQDLSAADPYYITPILLGIGMVIQQKLTPNPTMDKTQARVMMMMPVMFTFMMLSLPAGMVLYMITNTVVSIAQQQWLNKRLDVKLAKAEVAA